MLHFEEREQEGRAREGAGVANLVRKVKVIIFRVREVRVIPDLNSDRGRLKLWEDHKKLVVGADLNFDPHTVQG